MELKKIQNTDIYEFRSTEKLTEKDAEKLSQSFKEFKENGQKINLLGIIDKFPMPESVPSIDEILSLKKSSMNVVKKYAILSDKEWLEKSVHIGNFFTPNIPLKTFDKDNRKEAIDWLKKEKLKEYNPKDYLSNIDIEKLKPNAFKINISHEKINRAAMTAILNLINNEEKGEKLNILVIYQSFPSFDSLKTIAEGLKVDFKAIGKIKKYAVVSDAKWTETFSKIGDFLTPGMDIEFFPMSELEKAENWIKND